MRLGKTNKVRSRAAKAERGTRHPLLLHQRLSEQHFWPSVLIVALSAVLLVWNPAQLKAHRPYLVVVLGGTGLILVVTQLFRLRAYAQCRASGLRLQLPFYHLTIPYREIRTSRPTEIYRLFPPEEQHWSRRRFLAPLWDRTVVVIEVDEVPRSRLWLRLWMGRYVLPPDSVGLIVPVRDWIAFRTELDEFRYRHRHA